MKRMIEGIERNWDTAAPVEVRKCCANYDTAHGCLFRKNCTAPKCGYYQKVVLKVAAVEGALTEKRAKQVGGQIRTCPDCEKTLKPGERYCKICRIKRRRASIRSAVARKRAATA